MPEKSNKSLAEDMKRYLEYAKSHLDDIYKKFFEMTINHPKYASNACMFIGETAHINKINLTYNILNSYGLEKWDGTKGDFILIDSELQNTSYEAALEIVEKYKDLKFVIVANCANIFHSDDLVLLYKIISDDDRTIDNLYKQPSYKIKVSAYYVFLSDKDITADLEFPEKGKAFISCTAPVLCNISF